MKLLLLYKGYLPNLTLQEGYRRLIDNILGSEVILNFAQLPYGSRKKIPAIEVREWTMDRAETFNQFDFILLADSDVFKVLTKNKKSEVTLGMAQNSSQINSKVFYCPSPVIYQLEPEKHQKQLQSVLEGIKKVSEGKSSWIEPEIHSEKYPVGVEEIRECLNQLHQYPMLFCDIEAKSLKLTEAGIYTIGFAWDKHNGICFPVDAHSEPESIKELLSNFFKEYEGKLAFHKANYDVPILIYNLYQKSLTDIEGQLYGLDTLFKDNRIEDTLIITYLSTNSCSGNVLTLKELAQPYVGEYAVDVSDVTKVPLDKLMKYNLIDCLGTAYVYDTYFPKMVEEEQDKLYYEFMLPTLRTNIRCQLNGLPIDISLVQKFESDLNQEQEKLLKFLKSTIPVKSAEVFKAEKNTIERNSKLKKKITTVEDNYKELNFASHNDLILLIHDIMQLPVIDTTDSGKSALGKDNLRDLVNHTDNQLYKDILNSIADLKDVDKISNSFIPAFKEAHQTNRLNRLLGYFNLGGTVSGRLSSSNINLQNLPATGSRFAKPTKKCFVSSDEWLFAGIDYNSLEAKIDALTTKDPNKLKIYSEGWDSHCLNAVIAFGSQMPDINPSNREEVNSIKDKYPKLRQMAKAVGFALQYGGTDSTLVNKSGLTPELAKEVYDNYNSAYKVSVEWKETHIKSAYINGYITTGFGLKVRTPYLKGKPYKLNRKGIEGAEARTAGNALGQGWGVLNDRAMNEVMNQVDELGLSYDILPIAKIHDCCYYLVRNNINTLLTLNQLVVKEANWNNHPLIYHPEVSLGGQLDVFYPNWATPMTLPEDCNEETLLKLVEQHT